MIKPDTSISEVVSDNVRAALVIAHPGHELCLYGWLKRARPKVFILTDGSGHTGSSRLERTTCILNGLGAVAGSFYGRFSDASIYEALLKHQFDLFVRLAQELAAQLLHDGINVVVGDACEGYNPTHDVCRLVINAAVEIAGQSAVGKIHNLEFLVTHAPNPKLIDPQAQSVRIQLDEESFEQKLTAARSYLELKDEVEAFIGTHSAESFRYENLYPVNGNNGNSTLDGASAYYEEHGEQRVKQGYYKEVIRYREHILPLAITLGQVSNKRVYE